MTQEKKTEEQLRHDIRKEFSFSEKTDKEKIDSILETKKDAYKNRQKLKENKLNVEPAKGKKEPDGNQDPKGENYSIKDYRALSTVEHDEDVETIVDFAKANDISIPEAKAHKDVQFILKGRKEERKTAEASNTGGGKRGSSKVSDEKIIADANDGKEVDPEQLAEARSKARVNKTL